MSNKSTGTHLMVPDEPVKEYSAQLNSHYETLHRCYSTLLEFPDISTINILIDECENIFYAARELLEEDYGIHPYTTKVLDVPECGYRLRQLVQWEDNDEMAKKEYFLRQKDGSDSVEYPGHYVKFWSRVRCTLWQIERCLQITRERVSTNNKKYPLGETRPRYPWVTANVTARERSPR